MIWALFILLVASLIYNYLLIGPVAYLVSLFEKDVYKIWQKNFSDQWFYIGYFQSAGIIAAEYILLEKDFKILYNEYLSLKKQLTNEPADDIFKDKKVKVGSN